MVSCELWSINRILRFTGFRIYIQVDGKPGEVWNPEKPTRVDLAWYGWKFLTSK